MTPTNQWHNIHWQFTPDPLAPVMTRDYQSHYHQRDPESQDDHHMVLKIGGPSKSFFTWMYGIDCINYILLLNSHYLFIKYHHHNQLHTFFVGGPNGFMATTTRFPPLNSRLSSQQRAVSRRGYDALLDLEQAERRSSSGPLEDPILGGFLGS